MSIKCWLCEKEFSGPGYPTIFGMECPECGPPQPMGPTAEEGARKRPAPRIESDADYFYVYGHRRGE